MSKDLLKSVKRNVRVSFDKPLMVSTFGCQKYLIVNGVNISLSGLLISALKTPFQVGTLVEITFFDEENKIMEKFWGKIVRKEMGLKELLAINFILEIEDKKRLEKFFKTNIINLSETEELVEIKVS